MKGGLFGDLPSTKGENKSEHDADNDSNNINGNSTLDSTSVVPAVTARSASTTLNNENNQSVVTAGKDTNTTNTSSNKKGPSLSLAKQLGKVGTRINFLPSSFQQRKKNNKASIATSANSNTATAATNHNIQSGSLSASSAVIAPKVENYSLHSSDHKNVVVTTSEKSYLSSENDKCADSSAKFLEDEEIRQLHLAVSQAAAQIENAEGRHRSKKQHINYDFSDDSSIIIPYDPMLPNDYLAYKEAQKKKRRREDLAKAAKETLRQQELLRERIAEERRKAEETGDVEKILQSRQIGMTTSSDTAMGRGRGRGRGVSNLPAWLLKKQEEEKLNSSQASVLPNYSKDSQFADAQITAAVAVPITNLRLVILKNLVAPGEIDQELEQEVKEECENLCGPNSVISVSTKDTDNNHDVVRVFVLFRSSDLAAHASISFNGRIFGGRQVSAEVISEDKTPLFNT